MNEISKALEALKAFIFNGSSYTRHPDGSVTWGRIVMPTDAAMTQALEVVLSTPAATDAPPKPDNIKTQWAKWFPTDVLMNPMREVPGKPGTYEVARWPSEAPGPEPDAGQCGEVCERSKLCGTCARGLEAAPEPVALKEADSTMENNGGRTGSPPGLLQDDSSALSKALARDPNARQLARDAALAASQPAPVKAKGELGSIARAVFDHWFDGWVDPNIGHVECTVERNAAWACFQHFFTAHVPEPLVKAIREEAAAPVQAQAVPAGLAGCVLKFLDQLDGAYYSLSADAHLALADLRREAYAAAPAHSNQNGGE